MIEKRSKFNKIQGRAKVGEVDGQDRALAHVRACMYPVQMKFPQE